MSITVMGLIWTLAAPVGLLLAWLWVEGWRPSIMLGRMPRRQRGFEVILKEEDGER